MYEKDRHIYEQIQEKIKTDIYTNKYKKKDIYTNKYRKKTDTQTYI